MMTCAPLIIVDSSGVGEGVKFADDRLYRGGDDLCACFGARLRGIGADSAIWKTAAVIFGVVDRPDRRDLRRHLDAFLRLRIREVGDRHFRRRGMMALADWNQLPADV